MIIDETKNLPSRSHSPPSQMGNGQNSFYVRTKERREVHLRSLFWKNSEEMISPIPLPPFFVTVKVHFGTFGLGNRGWGGSIWGREFDRAACPYKGGDLVVEDTICCLPGLNWGQGTVHSQEKQIKTCGRSKKR